MDGDNLKHLVFAVILFFLSQLAGYIMVFTPMNDILAELAEIRASDVIGVLGTIYALITAFILVNVWQHYTETENSIANENEALIALWNNTDYLEDMEITHNMKEALISYIERTIEVEFPTLKSGRLVEFPSDEFIRILRVIDMVKFDDPRDPIAFEALISSYKTLSQARNARIMNTINRIPVVLKSFYKVASFIFWFGYLIEGFESIILYFIVLIMVSIVVIFSYIIITDLDTTLSGSLVVSIERYYETKRYIESTKHEINE